MACRGALGQTGSMVLGELVEVRPGRRVYVQTVFGDPRGELAHCGLVALLVIGAMCHHSQVRPGTREAAAHPAAPLSFLRRRSPAVLRSMTSRSKP